MKSFLSFFCLTALLVSPLLSQEDAALIPVTGDARFFYNTFHFPSKLTKFEGKSENEYPLEGNLFLYQDPGKNFPYLYYTGSFRNGRPDGYGMMQIAENGLCAEKKGLLDWVDKNLDKGITKRGYWKAGKFEQKTADSLAGLAIGRFDFRKLFDLPTTTQLDSFTIKPIDVLLFYDPIKEKFLYSYYIFATVSFYLKHPNSGRYQKFMVGTEIYRPNPFAEAFITPGYFNQEAKNRYLGAKAYGFWQSLTGYAQRELVDAIQRGGGIKSGNFVTKSSATIQTDAGRYQKTVTILVRKEAGYKWRQMGSWLLEWKPVSSIETHYWTNTQNGSKFLTYFLSENEAMEDIYNEARQLYDKYYSTDQPAPSGNNEASPEIETIDRTILCKNLDRDYLHYLRDVADMPSKLNHDWTDTLMGGWIDEKNRFYLYIQPYYWHMFNKTGSTDVNGREVDSQDKTYRFTLYFSTLDFDCNQLEKGKNLYKISVLADDSTHTFRFGERFPMSYTVYSDFPTFYAAFMEYPNDEMPYTANNDFGSMPAFIALEDDLKHIAMTLSADKKTLEIQTGFIFKKIETTLK